MKNNYLDLTLIEFLDAITNTEQSNFNELSEIEIYNYLEKITSNFDTEKTEMIYLDIDVYYNMEFLERVNAESEHEYNKNNWNIPTYKKANKIEEDFEFTDYATMRAKTHPFDSWDIERVRHLLQDKLNEQEHNKATNENPHPRIFKEKIHFDFFTTLQKSIINELADYSFIFRKMQKDNYIYSDIKESAFRKWLFENYEVNIDKLKLIDYCKTDTKMNYYNTAILSHKL